MRKGLMVTVSLLLVSGLMLIGACGAGGTERTVIKEVPVEKVVAKEVVKQVAAEDYDDESSGIFRSKGDAGSPATISGSGFEEDTLTIDRMIVRSGSMNLKVRDVAEALDRIKGIAEWLGGYVVTSNWHGEEKERTATISIRVPAEKYDDALTSLRDMAVEVLLESTRAKDVTEEFTDLEAQLRNLEATESRYLELLEKADTVEDMLKIEGMLSETRGRIEQTKGRMQYLERTSATSLIEIYLVEDRPLEVEFNANRINVEEGEWMYFTNDAIGGSSPYGYKWDFGDDESSTERNPSKRYDEPGTFTVSLTVTDADGNADTEIKEDYITVVAEPGWSAGNVARSAWRGLSTIGRGLGNFLIWVGILAAIWIPIGLVIYWIIRRRRKGAQ